MEEALRMNNVVGVLIEPIQGEAGVNVPMRFIKNVAELCKQYNALFMADEIQTGIGRTGGLLAVCGQCNCEAHCETQESYTRPDVLILVRQYRVEYIQYQPYWQITVLWM